MKTLIKIQILIFSLLTVISLNAQVDEGIVLDKIVAIVGNQMIMKSDVEGRIEVLKQQDRSIDSQDPNIKMQVLESLINEKLIITKAIEDSVEVTEDEINTEWDRFKENLINYYGSISRVEDIYGMSFSRIQYENREVIREQLLAQKLQQQMFMGMKVTPKEVEDFFAIYKDSLPDIPAQIELYHIVKYVSASGNAKEEVFELAKKVRDTIVTGGLFSDFAKRYSKDPGTASDGGELGWVAKGKLFKEFEKAAFELVPGKTSMPVETPFGYHIIQTLDKNKDSVLVRHILFRIGNNPEDIKRTKDFLVSLKDSLKAGTDFETLAKKYSDDKDTRGFGGALGTFPVDQIPANFRDIVFKVSIGEASDPMPYNVDPTKPAFHIIYKKSLIPAHKPNIKDDYKILEQKALNYKQVTEYNQWMQGLRKELYWEIK